MPTDTSRNAWATALCLSEPAANGSALLLLLSEVQANAEDQGANDHQRNLLHTHARDRAQTNDVGDTPGFDGDHVAALAAINAEVLYMPCERDLYFHIDALQEEAQFIPNVQYTVIPGVSGHSAGGGGNPEDAAFIERTIREFLR